MPEDHPPGSTRGSLRHRRPKVHGKDEGGEASPHDVFPEVPASERRVEKPLRCSYGSNKFGTLHITRNYLCWAGMGGKSVVIHFGEIAAVERESSIFGSIEVKTRMESPAAALPACANETLYDWGPGVSKCSLCGANPCWNRGCKKCNARLCSDCFEEHKEVASASSELHYFKPLSDMDRVFSMIHSLWRAHLRIPVEKRRGRPEPVEPEASDVDDEGTASDDGEDYHDEDDEDTLLSLLEYPGPTSADMFSAPVTLREQPRAAEMTLQDVPLSRVFKRLFSDGSTFLPKYHAARSEDNFTPSLWTRPEGKMSCGVRYASCVVPTPMGRKQLYEACRYWWVADTVAVQCSSQVPDITFGSNFRTETFYEFRKKSDGSVAVSLFSNINFLKSPGFLGSTIKKAATKACDEAAQGFTAAARKALIKRSKAAGDSSEPDEEDEPATSTTSPDRRYASLMDGLTYVLSVCVAVALLLFFALVFSSPGALLSAPEAGNRDLIARRAEEFAAAYPSLAVAPVELAVPHLRSEVVLYHLLDQQLQHLQLLQRLAGTSFVFIGTIFALRRLNHN